MMKKHLATYGGVLGGGLYGLLMRVFFGVSFKNSDFDFVDLFSITFVWIVPIFVGMTPLIFSNKGYLGDMAYRIFKPVFSVLTFFVFCFVTRLEDIVCLIVLALPFLFVAGIAGAIFGGFILRYRQRKGILYSVFFLPLITGVIEPSFPTPTGQYETTSSILINADKSEIWENIVRVREIKNDEYEKGFFNFAGIPRPLYAELDKDTLGGLRIGHFEGGLQFQENIIDWSKGELVTFDIKIIPSPSNRTIFEMHMLNGEHFKFLNATYRLKQVSNNKTELLLTTKYQLDTKINFYGEFWGQQLLADFQDRLLSVIKTRCEK